MPGLRCSLVGRVFSSHHIRIEDDGNRVVSRLKAWLCHPLIVRIMFGAIALSAVSFEISRISDPYLVWANPLAHAILQISAVIAASSIVYCIWIEYCVSARRGTLISALGFLMLSFGMFAHAVFGFISVNGMEVSAGVNTIVYGLFRLGAATLIIIGAVNNRTDMKDRHCSRGLKVMLISSLSALVLILATPEFPLMLARVISVIHLDKVSTRLSADELPVIFALRVLALAAFTTALIMNIRAHMKSNDTISYGISLCLLFMTASQALLLDSATRNDLSWWLSHVMNFIGMLVFLSKLGGEFVVSFVQAKERIEELEAMHSITSQLSQTLDLRVVLLSFTNETATMLSARFASVMLADHEGKTLSTFCTHGLPNSPLSFGCPQEVEGSGRPGFYSGHTARAFRDKQICMVDDVYTDVEFVPWKILAENEGSVVSVPLVFQGVALGVLNLFFDKHIAVNDEKIKLLQTLGSSAAVSIANAQMYDRSLQMEAESFRLRPAS